MVKRDFDKEALTWETPPRIKMASDIGAAMLQKLHLTRDMNVLDFGCGTGLIAMQIVPHVRFVTGADTSRGMLDVFQNKAKGASLDNIKISCLDLADEVPLVGEYHLITSSMTLHHIKDVRALLGQFYRLLLPGGHVAVADLDEESGFFHSNNDGVFHFGFDRELLRGFFQEAGFTDVHDTTATQIQKPDAAGMARSFPVFLMIARK